MDFSGVFRREHLFISICFFFHLNFKLHLLVVIISLLVFVVFCVFYLFIYISLFLCLFVNAINDDNNINVFWLRWENKIVLTHRIEKTISKKVMQIFLSVSHPHHENKIREKIKTKEKIQFVKLLNWLFFCVVAHMYENIFVAFLFCRARFEQ